MSYIFVLPTYCYFIPFTLYVLVLSLILYISTAYAIYWYHQHLKYSLSLSSTITVRYLYSLIWKLIEHNQKPCKSLLSIPLSIFLRFRCFWSDVYCQFTGFIFTSDVSCWSLKRNVNVLLWPVIPEIRRLALFKGLQAYPACPSDEITKKVNRSMEHMIMYYIYIYSYMGRG